MHAVVPTLWDHKLRCLFHGILRGISQLRDLGLVRRRPLWRQTHLTFALTPRASLALHLPRPLLHPHAANPAHPLSIRVFALDSPSLRSSTSSSGLPHPCLSRTPNHTTCPPSPARHPCILPPFGTSRPPPCFPCHCTPFSGPFHVSWLSTSACFADDTVDLPSQQLLCERSAEPPHRIAVWTIGGHDPYRQGLRHVQHHELIPEPHLPALRVGEDGRRDVHERLLVEVEA